MHWLYHLLSWTWGGDHQGGANSTGYLIFSGPLADLTILTAAIGWYVKHNCHVKRCLRMGRHSGSIDGHQQTFCRKHHPTLS